MAKKNPMRVLAVDDNKNTLEVIQRNLINAGYGVLTSSNVDEAVKILQKDHVDIVITDFRMPGTSGLDLVKYINENHKNIEVMMITGYPSIEGAVEAVKEGAQDYLAKPFTEKELLSALERTIEKMLRRGDLQSKVMPERTYGIIGESEVMKEVLRLIEKAAATTANVLVSGDSGTGKELVARAIHYNSERSSAPFVSVNCTAIPDTLLESELFGHVKGAFTGANASRAGFFQIAHGGTVFLDEIGDASLNMQGKLLRVIQNGEIYMVGSSHMQKVDTRIIAATHKDLLDQVRKGHFREDLYYRLAVVDIPIPPLYERGNDILLLIQHFTEKFSKEMSQPRPSFSDNALRTLKNYRWPGNIRELENLIQRLMVIVDGNFVDVADLPPTFRFSLSPAKKWKGSILSEF